MNKGLAAIGAGIVAIYVFFQVFTGLGGMVPGLDGSDTSASFAEGPQMRGCLRNLAKEGASEAQAQQTCTCMFNEFEKRGLSLWDAAGDRFDEMSEISQVCASRAGVQLPGSGY